MATLHDAETIRVEWKDSQPLSDEFLSDLIEAARVAVLAYGWSAVVGPAWDAANPDEFPATVRYWHALHVRHIYTTWKVNPSGSSGGEGFRVTPVPLDWQVRQGLRPRRAIGPVG